MKRLFPAFAVRAFITTVAVTTMIGTCNGAMIVGDEALQSFLVRHQPTLFKSHKKRTGLVSWLIDIDNRVAPSIVLLNSAILCISSLLPLDLILSSSLVVFNINVLLLLVAYVYMKRKHPSANWLYTYGWISALLITLPPLSFIFFMTYEALFDYPVTLGVPYINLIVTIVIIGVGFLAHWLFHVLSKQGFFKQAVHRLSLVDSTGTLGAPDDGSELEDMATSGEEVEQEALIKPSAHGVEDHRADARESSAMI